VTKISYRPTNSLLSRLTVWVMGSGRWKECVAGVCWSISLAR